MRTCETCPTRLSPLARVDARFCSVRCRVAAHRARHRQTIPTALLERDRWVRWSSRKVPLTVDGRAASSTDPRTWSTFTDAARSTVGVGIGFVLDGDGIVCVDLDDCLEDGVLVPWAAALLEDLPSTWIEVSPSGRGLHVWGFGTVTQGRRVQVGSGVVEVYGTGRYLTVTGRGFDGAPPTLADLGTLDSLFA